MSWFSSQQIQRDMTSYRYILRAIVLANATLVFTKADIEHPMARIFYTPVSAHRLGETRGISWK
jgi:hypothetical protein